MLKTCLIRFSCFIIAFSSLFCLFDGFSFTPVAADTLPEANIVEDEEIDPKYYQFVGRLYSIVTRRDTCDPSEKEEMARSLKGGITEAYNILYHFYFSNNIVVVSYINVISFNSFITAV